jgi:hypothetical protein
MLATTSLALAEALLRVRFAPKLNPQNSQDLCFNAQ